ncbi:hypothetical protein [Deinococcus arenicola]|uniref:Uncharacterized protein n=1 Tax=Deinococcus arenicola TaxID=2994950 RepID=A0ABU4DPE6_9DEIO|nr:hypothetical protein [Deinococcus sp. ZS9-10]MDV6374296.1 hypothetical protein [Deinococcus sp. ZS9-10]
MPSFPLRLTLGLVSLTLTGAQVACAQAAPTALQTLNLPAPAVWLAAEALQIYAVTEKAELWRVSNGKATVLAKNFSSAFITACSGRVVGVNGAGQLQVWNGEAVESAPNADLSPLAHPVCLPFGIVAATRAGDLVRFDPAAGSWREAARTPANALPDAQLMLADLDGGGEEVVALTRPDATRYGHGILGDTAEPTEITVFERHSLSVLSRLSLPAPFVFEDLQARPVKLEGVKGGNDSLAVVRSSPGGGAALALISKGQDGLKVQATGPDFGQTHRWLTPVVGFGQVWAVKTPHIGGQLTQYTRAGNTLKTSPPFAGVSSHGIGSRNLNAAVLTAPGQLVVPSQDHRNLLSVECRTKCQITAKLALGGTYSSNLLFASGQVWMGDSSGKLHGWTVK